MALHPQCTQPLYHLVHMVVQMPVRQGRASRRENGERVRRPVGLRGEQSRDTQRLGRSNI